MNRLVCAKLILTLIHTVVLTESNKVSTAFEKANIVPDILYDAPKKIATVSFPTAEVCLGNEIRASETLSVPKISYDYKPGVNYTLFFANLDLPSATAPALRSVITWMVVNIPGDKVEAGYTVAAYVPAIDVLGGGYKRWVYLVYAQRKALDVTDRNLLRLAVDRFGLCIPDVAKRFGLGPLFAGNFFITRLHVNIDEPYCSS